MDRWIDDCSEVFEALKGRAQRLEQLWTQRRRVRKLPEQFHITLPESYISQSVTRTLPESDLSQSVAKTPSGTDISQSVTRTLPESAISQSVAKTPPGTDLSQSVTGTLPESDICQSVTSRRVFIR